MSSEEDKAKRSQRMQRKKKAFTKQYKIAFKHHKSINFPKNKKQEYEIDLESTLLEKF